MRVVSYNLHFGGNKGAGNPWQKLFQELAPEIVFAQETFDPTTYLSAEGMRGVKGCVWSKVDGRAWGSAILSTVHKLTPVHLPMFEGWVVGARIENLVLGGKPQSAMLCSIHAPSPGPYMQPTLLSGLLFSQHLPHCLDGLFGKSCWDIAADHFYELGVL